MVNPLVLDDVNSIAQIFALVSAGVFFLYRMVSGYFVVDLSLTLSTVRRPHDEHGKDHLIVVAHIKRGERGSLLLHDAKVRITYPNGGERIESLLGIYRVSFRTTPVASQDEQMVSPTGNAPRLISGDKGEKVPTRKSLNFSRRSTKAPLLRLTPGDATEFACLLTVPASLACCVEVRLLGKKHGSRRVAQWSASAVSLPLHREPVPPP